ncbi:MAG: hypothetical protein COU29_00440 [Candidatus Magasanikbacteria bacterium CG10_big_fil_rev_8_21_14_0_10_36_32]|uniref:Fibronectin type-III domain-containing protein n=1 Tax=Candidatus Magasanikbacteria bacterium CG10_big_fil_rev_8_21_14_0_10_36_32 TaxID=1974646 RepID=A0A2M6W7I9_9BACT|nr:MAG: hypothetical protein COU29_00440 [Candidatus Magasanikbacteria bacterium CG10_big_fil_rev_8_21_14_0_10_36_32]
MMISWLKIFFKLSGRIFELKQKLSQTDSWIKSLPYAFLLILDEIVFVFISLPLYFAVPPKKVQEKGILFPSAEPETERMKMFFIRRKISLIAFITALGMLVLKFLVIGGISFYLMGGQLLLAATQDWLFTVPGDYAYDSSKIEFVGGIARLKNLGTTVTGSTTNANFNTNATGWTYADWDQGGGEANVVGTYVASGGNPGGFVQINFPVGKSDEFGGYWRQGFAITENNPTATLSFDWSITAFDNTPAPVTFKLYAFIDTGTGVPVIGQEVWKSEEITATSAWVSMTNLNISSKVTAAGTYYLKIAVWLETPNNNTGPFTLGYDNVIVNWSKTTIVYDSNRPTIIPNNSLTPVNPAIWSSFTETATKNGGEIYYQLSADNGSTWNYWNGSSWISAGASNYNTAIVVNNNIAGFSTSTNKIKWKAFLESNGSQQVSLSKVSIGYTENSAPSISEVVPVQQTDKGQVYISYNLTDVESDPSSLITYEYSLTGAFSGEQVTMIASTTNPMHNGVSGLSASPSGISHIFVWDGIINLPNVYNTSTYVRLRANDGIASGVYVTSSAITIDYVAPVISNLSVTQNSGSANFDISYDLFDNTSDNINIVLEISDDGGLTWVVPTVSSVGDLGSSVTAGIGKVITWNAGVDYPAHQVSNMQVRLLVKDKYQNQSVYFNSVNFELDTLAPVAAITVDLMAQPNAGDTAVLIFGSFIETNPNYNNFFVGVNNGDYGSATVGDSNTISPSAQLVATGVTLTGADYIGKAKIAHTDDFGFSTDNENFSPNSSYKYVKPYTPPAPTVGNPAEGSLDVTINKYSSEADGLEYLVFENTQSKYIQGDGLLSDSPVWLSSGTITVIGLSDPLSQYIFKTKSRNNSDAAHTLTSESEWSSGASTDYQSPSVTINSVAQTINGTKYVTVDYVGIDFQNAQNNLVVYEYSTDGFGWMTMTEKVGVDSNGVSGLSFSSGGTAFKFAWDVGNDLFLTEDSTVYVRLQSNDSINSSNLSVSSAFFVDTAGPIISNINVSQATSSNNIIINYDLTDTAGADNFIELLISDDSGSSYVVSVSAVTGDIGEGVSSGIGKEIIWNAGTDFNGQEQSDMRIKIRAKDRYQNQGDFTESSDFLLDTKGPIVSDVNAVQSSSTVLINYTLSENVGLVVFEVSDDSGLTWVVSTSSVNGDIGADQLSGLKNFQWNAKINFNDQEQNDVMVRIRATDYFNNVGDYVSSAIFSLDTKPPVISNITANQTLNTKDFSFSYELSDASATATIVLDISSNSGLDWNVATSTLSGDSGDNITMGVKSLIWNAGTDFNDQESNVMRLRFRATDAWGNESLFFESSDFSVDTAAPSGLSELTKYSITATSVTLNWSSGVNDSNFNHYELWYGANQNDVLNRAGSADKWDSLDDVDLNNITTISTIISGTSFITTKYIKIWAVDNYGNESSAPDISVIYIPPTVTYDLIVQAPTGSGSINPAIGTHTYSKGTNVEITATPDSGWNFGGWILDDLSGGNTNPLTLIMNAAHTIGAVFSEETVSVPEKQAPSGGAPLVVIEATDTTPPTAPILTPVAGPLSSTRVKISGLAEPGSKLFLYDKESLVGQLSSLVGNNGRFEQTFVFNEGEHILTSKAVDTKGNLSQISESITFVIDLTPPDAPQILSPKENSVLLANELVLVGLSEPLTVMEINLRENIYNTVANERGVWQFNIFNVTEIIQGRQTVTVRAKDAAGNISRPVTWIGTVTVVTTTGAIYPIQILPPEIISPTPLAPASIIREVNQAIETTAITTPSVVSVEFSGADDIISFAGKAKPDEEVIIYIHSNQAVVYRTVADNQGNWHVHHSQNELELSSGEHTVYAVGINSETNLKSPPSLIGTFIIEKNWWVNIYRHFNFTSTLITIAVLLMVMSWLYWLRRRETVKI